MIDANRAAVKRRSANLPPGTERNSLVNSGAVRKLRDKLAPHHNDAPPAAKVREIVLLLRARLGGKAPRVAR
jgi:hypothetical protein